MRFRVSTFLHEQEGATAIEYGLIAGLISVVLLSVLTMIGANINAKFSNIAAALN